MSRNLLFVTTNVPLDDRSGGQIATWRLLESYAHLGEVDVLALVPPKSRPPTQLNELARRVAFVPIPHFHHATSRARSVGVFLRSFLARKPFRIAKFESRDAGRTLGEWSEIRLIMRLLTSIHCPSPRIGERFRKRRRSSPTTTWRDSGPRPSRGSSAIRSRKCCLTSTLDAPLRRKLHCWGTSNTLWFSAITTEKRCSVPTRAGGDTLGLAGARESQAIDRA